MKKTWCGLTLAAALAFMTVVLFIEVRATMELHRDYAALTEQELSEEEITYFGYSDGILVQMLFGSTDTAVTMKEYLHKSIREVTKRLLGAGTIYAAAVSLLMSYPLAYWFGGEKKKHILSVVLCCAAAYLMYLAAIFVPRLVTGLPLCLEGGGSLVTLFVGLLSGVGGSCAFGAWMRAGKDQIVISILAGVLFVSAYLFGLPVEAGLFCEKEETSFAYLEEIEPGIFEDDYDGGAYLNEDRMAVVLNGKEYPPEPGPNPDYYTGLKRAGAIAFEAVDPYNGIGLPLLEHAGELDIPALSLLLYLYKALVWTLLPAVITGKREKQKAEITETSQTGTAGVGIW